MASRSACSRAGATPMRASSTRAGCLAGPEARDANLSGDLAERSVDVSIELGLVDLDGQLDQGASFVPFEGFERALHKDATLPVPSSEPGPTFSRRAWREPMGQDGGRMPTWKPHALAKPHPDQLDLRMHDKVVAKVELPGVPAGTKGKVILADGFNWLRYRGPVRQRCRARRPGRAPPRAHRPLGSPAGQAGQAHREGPVGAGSRPRAPSRAAVGFDGTRAFGRTDAGVRPTTRAATPQAPSATAMQRCQSAWPCRSEPRLHSGPPVRPRMFAATPTTSARDQDGVGLAGPAVGVALARRHQLGAEHEGGEHRVERRWRTAARRPAPCRGRPG